MSKIFSLSLLAIVCLTFTNCKKLASVLPDVTITPNLSTGNIAVNAMKAAETFTKDTSIVATAVTDAVKSSGQTTTAVKTVTITAFELTIPAGASWSFADVESGDVSIDGVIVGTFPAGTTGKTATFAPPATQSNIKASILSTSGFKLKYNMKAKNATTAALLTGVLKTKVTLGL
jgi:hypothetical protein